MKLVIIESPYAGNIKKNVHYARQCVRHSLRLGEAPLASHLLYTQEGILKDDIYDERVLGMEAGFAWGKAADYVVAYTDLGVSPGMRVGIERARAAGLPVVYRRIQS